MGSSANLIQVGAVFDVTPLKTGAQEAAAAVDKSLAQMQAAFNELKATTSARIAEIEAKLAEMSEAHVVHAAKSSEAMHAMGLSMEATGVTISRHLRSVINELPILSKAFELAFPLFAAAAGIDILKKFGEKIGELISDTFIFTDAMKAADAALKAENKTLADTVDQVKALTRETMMLQAATATQKDKLREAFAFDDIGGDPAKLRTKLDGVLAEFNKLSAALNQPNRFAVPDALKELGFSEDSPGKRVEEAKAKLDSLANQVLGLRAALSLAEATAGKFNVVLGKDTTDAAEKAARELEKEGKAAEALHNKFVAMVYAERQAMADKADAHEKAEAQETIAVTKEVEKQNQEVIKAADEQIRIWDEAYKGQIEAAKIASENRIQLIEQDFLKGKLNQQQEITAIAQEKERELQIEKLAQQQRWALWDGDKKKQQDIQNQINKIVAQGQLAETKAVTDGLKASDQKWKSFANSVSSSLNSALSGWIQGTQTFGQAWGKMADDMAMKFISSLERQLVEMLVHVATKEAVDQAYYAKSGLRSAYSAAKKSFDWASQFVGPILAAPIAAAAFIAVESMGSYDVGTNYVPMDGLAMLHRGEKVIPASAQGPGFSGGGDIHVHVQMGVSAVDADSFGGLIDKHSNMIGNKVARILKRRGSGK